MPIISVKVLEGVFDQSQLEAMVDEFTNAMCRVAGEGIRPATHVTIEEIRSGLWGDGGNKLRTDEVLARRAARKQST